MQGPPCTQDRTFAFWDTPAGGNAHHASTDLSQCTSESKKKATDAQSTFLGCTPPTQFATRAVAAPCIWSRGQRMKNRSWLWFYDVIKKYRPVSKGLDCPAPHGPILPITKCKAVLALPSNNYRLDLLQVPRYIAGHFISNQSSSVRSIPFSCVRWSLVHLVI